MQVYIDFLLNFVNEIGYIGVYIYMLLVGTFIPVPSELVLLPAGYLASTGEKSYFLLVLFGSLGSISGALINYYFAIYLTQHFFKNNKTIDKITIFFKNHGKISVFLAPLTPGLGQYISIPAGISKMSLLYFIPIVYSANIIWVNFMLLIGYMFGNDASKSHQMLIYATTALLTFVIIFSSIYIYREIKKTK
jgi:membrane protein DedA with SNARE-associated domain